MLVLTRRVGQRIKIGDDVEVTVLQISGDQVRLGIEAPREVKVYRTEILEQIAEANILAAKSASESEDVGPVSPASREQKAEAEEDA